MSDDPFFVVKPADGDNRNMSTYLKKQSKSAPQCPETSSRGSRGSHSTSSTRSTQASTASQRENQTPSQHSKKSPSSDDGFGNLNSAPAIAFNSDFGNGLEFGGNGDSGFGDDGFGATQKQQQSQPSKKEKPRRPASSRGFSEKPPSSRGEKPASSRALKPASSRIVTSSRNKMDHDDGFGGSDPFGSSDPFDDGFGSNEDVFPSFGNDRIEPMKFGDSFGSNDNSFSVDSQEQHKGGDAWKKREAWKNGARSHSTSSGSKKVSTRSPHDVPHAAGSKERRPGTRRTHSSDSLNSERTPPGPPRDEIRSPKPQSRRDLRVGAATTTSRDHSPKPQSRRDLRGGAAAVAAAATSRDHRPPPGGGGDRKPAPPQRTMSHQRRRTTMNTSSGHGDESSHSNNTPTNTQGAERQGLREPKERPLRSRRRASLAYSQSDGAMEPVEMESGHQQRKAPARQKSMDGLIDYGYDEPQGSGHQQRKAPTRQKSMDGSASTRQKSMDGSGMIEYDEPQGGDATSRARARRGRRASMAAGAENALPSDSAAMNNPAASNDKFARERTRNQQNIMDMFKNDGMKDDTVVAKPKSTSSLDMSFDDFDVEEDNSQAAKKMFGKSAKGDFFGSSMDEGVSASPSIPCIPSIKEPPVRRLNRRASLTFTRKPKEQPKEEPQYDQRQAEGRNRATLLERVAAAGSNQSRF
jgi:hypothetical protein